MTVQQQAFSLRAREKLLISGAHNLSDIELLSVFIDSGGVSQSCLQLADQLMTDIGDFRALLNADLHAFEKIGGLGKIRYSQLQAIKEICLRSEFISLQKEVQLTSSLATHIFLKRKLRDKKNETFVALFLDSQHRVLTYEELFNGTIDSAIIHPRPIIERILRLNAASIILAHNHPSGISDPSRQDITVTERLKAALDLIDVKLLDHLVIGDNEVYSILNKMKWHCN
ncbi:MAG: RadC family protein [Legionella sp.]